MKKKAIMTRSALVKSGPGKLPTTVSFVKESDGGVTMHMTAVFKPKKGQRKAKASEQR